MLPKINFKIGSEVSNRIDAARAFLERCQFHEAMTKDGITALRNYKKKKHAGTGQLVDTPEHNWACHGADAFGYLALGMIQVKRQDRPKPNVRWVT